MSVEIWLKQAETEMGEFMALTEYVSSKGLTISVAGDGEQAQGIYLTEDDIRSLRDALTQWLALRPAPTPEGQK